MASKQISFRLSEDQAMHLAALAKKRGESSLNLVARELLIRALEQQDLLAIRLEVAAIQTRLVRVARLLLLNQNPEMTDHEVKNAVEAYLIQENI